MVKKIVVLIVAFVLFPKPSFSRDDFVRLDPVFVEIPGGNFFMGASVQEISALTRRDQGMARALETARHLVTISQPYEMQITETTQDQWYRVMGDNPSFFSEEKYCPNEFDAENRLCSNLPVENMSWLRAQEFITSKNSLNDGFVYRLPTEAEWERAARGGRDGRIFWFWFGTDQEMDEMLPRSSWVFSNSIGPSGERQTHKVGQLLANPYGLRDIHGNVDEWVFDFHDRPYSREHVIDPRGPLLLPGQKLHRSFRGCHYGRKSNLALRNCRAAYRNFDDSKKNGAKSLGLRLVRTSL